MSQGGGAKTEQPTEKRKRDARRRGQVARSHDLSSALLLLTAILVLWASGGWSAKHLTDTMRYGIEGAASFQGELNTATALSALFSGVRSLGLALLPLFAGLLVIALVVSYLQVGPVFAFEVVKPNLNKLNPAEAFKNKFLKPRPYLELGKTILKIIVVAFVLASTIWSARGDIVELTRQSVPRVASFTLSLVLEIGLKVALVFLLLSIGDYFLQRYLHLKELKMTKQEVKEEYKETEGDPLYKSLRRQMHREILTQSMLSAVGRADVVVVNPTHVAVALIYDRQTMAAPTVVAKGAELMAARIREIAKESDVPIMQDVPLARALYELEIDSEIPEDLFEAVAIVLRWVYQMTEEKKGGAQTYA